MYENCSICFRQPESLIKPLQHIFNCVGFDTVYIDQR